MANDDSEKGAICLCCGFLILLFIFNSFTATDTDYDLNQDLIDMNNTNQKNESIEIFNLTNITLKNPNMTFVYYDHNSTNFNGCYGLNYTVIRDDDKNEYMLDHATTDIIGEKTNYTFDFDDGLILVFDNSTETVTYNESGYYYVHEIRDDNDNVIKSMNNFTLNDKSHEPKFIPTNIKFHYRDYDSDTYDGDFRLRSMTFDNTIGDKEKNITITTESKIIGMAYYANGDFDYYKYGLKDFGWLKKMENDDGGYRYSAGDYFKAVELPNGTFIRGFDIESTQLSRDEKNFLTDYYGRIDDVRYKQQLDAIDRAASDTTRSIYKSSQNQKDTHYISYDSYGRRTYTMPV